MIVVYPLIASKTISKNVIPGICKALEHYLLVYQTNDIIDTVNKQLEKDAATARRDRRTREFLNLKISPRGKIYGESYVIEQGTGSKADEFTPQPSITPQVTTNINPPPAQPRARETATVSKVDRQAITVEPTWITVDTPSGSKFIGVKLVPFYVENETSLLRLMLNDQNRKELDKAIHYSTRRLMRFIYRIANFLWKWTAGGLLSFTDLVGSDLKSSTITGNWKKEVILGQTSFDDNLFMLLNRDDLNDQFFEAKKIKKLFKLYWPSIVIADDINKIVNFCMKPFKGMCSTLNYSYLYSSVSRQTRDAYEDIEDVRRSSGPFSIKRGRFKDMINDNSMKYIDKYSVSTLMNEGYLDEQFINEGLFSDIKSNVSKYSKIIHNAILSTKNNDKNSLLKLAEQLKDFKLDYKTIYDEASKSMDNFKKYQQMAKKVLINSIPELPDKLADAGASVIAATSISSKKDTKQTMINSIKEVVNKTRKYQSKVSDEEWSREVLIAFVFAIIGVCIIGVLGVVAMQTISTILVKFGPAVVGAFQSFFGLLFILTTIRLLFWYLEEEEVRIS